MNRFLFCFLAAWMCAACSSPKELPATVDLLNVSSQKVPGTYFKEHRIFVKVPASSGDSISFYTDTGGGKVIYRSAVTALGLAIDSVEANGRLMERADLGPLFNQHKYPAPVEPNFMFDGDMNFDEPIGGLLGAIWFADKIWLFDYKTPALSTIDTVDWKRMEGPHAVKVGFMKNETGEHLTHFPRIPIIVEGDTIQTLFDSGAMVNVHDSTSKYFQGFTTAATSFIVASKFDAWHESHPDWLYIEKGDEAHGEHMIQVPEVQIGAYTVGPVWFTRRADTNFTEFMSQWMDETVYGAIGGSCFKYFETIILDYRKEWAYFER